MASPKNRPTLASIVAAYGAVVKSKLSNPAATGQPEDQLRTPFEELILALGEMANLPRNKVTLVGESSISDLKTRPDYAVSVHNALVGFIELKAPGKGADPRKFKDLHDKAQWRKLSSLPNLLYSDGKSFSLWRSGELVGEVVHMSGDLESAGEELKAPKELASLIEELLNWYPVPPRSVKELALMSARLCRLLRDEVTEQMAMESHALTSLAKDWRQLLFPEATDEVFADGYAQAVTFGLLMARAKDIDLDKGLNGVADALSKSSSLIGTALRLLTDNTSRDTLKTSLATLIRVLNVVVWDKLSKGDADAWLYFYEDFLGVYDNALRKQTGSYYTPPEVVNAMTALVDEALRSPRFSLHGGLAAPSVVLVDPATGTGTFMLGALRRIAENVKRDQGEGAVAEAIQSAVKRLVAFEMQLGPFAVAQLRIVAEIVELTRSLPRSPVRMFVTNTLGDPRDDGGWIPAMLQPISESRKAANKFKREEAVTVVIGNPPYKDKAKGKGAWIEQGNPEEDKRGALFMDWMPPKEWGVSAHAKHLYNLYVYFWRWATWQVFDHEKGKQSGVVCYITVSGFLNGPGFQRMREYMRRTCDDIWVIDCSPEGHQPEVNTRIFQGVQQPVCIVLASRSSRADEEKPAKVLHCSLPATKRVGKFEALARISLKDESWVECPAEWRAPFLPESMGAWASFPALADLFAYNGSGVMPGRTWVIAPDEESLQQRWRRLISAPPEEKEALFHPHMRKGELGDKHSLKEVKTSLAGFPSRPLPVAMERGESNAPVPYAFRSFDRQWIIPDNRLINQPNPELWARWSEMQVFLTALERSAPGNGPALTFSGLIPDLDHFKGSFGGRIFPLWNDAHATEPNVLPALLVYLRKHIGEGLGAPEVMTYIAAVAANPAYPARFQEELGTPGLRIPLTRDKELFARAVALGRRVIWLHTFGERMTDDAEGRPFGPPRLPADRRPFMPAEGAIPNIPEDMPDTIGYDESTRRLHIGKGFIENVDAAVWNYEVSGKQVLKHWFSYRKLDRSRPQMGDRRPPSKLGDIQPDHWLAEYTTELINVLNILTMLVDLETEQAELLDRICASDLMTEAELKEAGALVKPQVLKKAGRKDGPDLFG
ncbi:MAG: N-6 DNA methylase [Flavobacteriales bacterium]|nr:N-6 DNA methylase [Flavobacteriales bacterium]